MKCIDCKFCRGKENGYFICHATSKEEYIEECIALDDNLECDLFDNNSNDDLTA